MIKLSDNNLIKLSQAYHTYNTQDVIENLGVLQPGDLIQIIKFQPPPIIPSQEKFYLPEAKPTILIAKNVVVSHVSGNTIFGWAGTGSTLSREESFEKALQKYQSFLTTENPKPSNIVTYDPNTWRILRVGNVADLDITPERAMPLTTEPWFGLGQKSGIWTPIKTSSNSTINEALKGIELNGTLVYREVNFHYVRKLKRHYPSTDTSTDRVVRPHFMYTISTKPGNEYLLARDYMQAGGEWRSFLIADRGVQRITNARLGEPFKFDTQQTMLYTKEGMKHIASRLLKDSIDKEDYKAKKKEHNLYNTLKTYYKHLRKLLKETKNEKHVKECCSYNKNFIFGDYVNVEYINGNTSNCIFSHWANNKLYGWENISGFTKNSKISSEMFDLSTIKDINKIGTVFSNKF